MDKAVTVSRLVAGIIAIAYLFYKGDVALALSVLVIADLVYWLNSKASCK